jgi:hypothetical protein
VTVAAALAAYAVCAGVLGPRLLGRADWAERAPRLAILTYLAAAWSVVAAFAGAGPVPETPALAAAGTDAVHRIQRLLAPAEPLGRVRRHLLRAVAAGLALVPLLLALAPAVAALALGRVQPA